MSHANPYEFQENPRPTPASAGSNTLGIVGFILSFCLSPVGLVISLISLSKPPRGFGIAGTVIGLIGTAIWAIVIIFGIAAGPMIVQGAELGVEHARMREALAAHATNNSGQFAPDLATAGVTGGMLTDPWGNPYLYAPGSDGTSWTITSIGADGQPGTPDDVVFTNTMTQEEVGQAIGKAMEAAGRTKWGAPPTGSTPTAPASAPAPAPTSSP